jgi:X-Pro dipeptidyl-peptidase C-terminal non-catalytic domain/X-Pro dipeptidyl-peptidase (S15 family)
MKLTVAWVGACMLLAAPAGAKVPASLYNPSNCNRITPATGYAVYKCDDGVPDFGGTTSNPTGAKAVTVPAKYGGDHYTGLPVKGPAAGSVPGADSNGDVALDVDLTLPTVAPPSGGYPMLVFMHGCCSGNKTSWEATSFDGADAGGEKWHYNNAWFAARGYVVLNYTARGFVDGSGHGSTGETELDSRSYEINDYQHLACQVLSAAGKFNPVTGRKLAVNPNKVVTTGGSYGGGFSWLALTDPKWTCTGGTGAGQTPMSLAATAPKYGWTDLLYSLVPTGTHLSEPGSLPAFNGCDSGPRKLDGSPCPGPWTPVGIPKKSIVTALYASGKTGVPPGSSHTTFPSKIDDAMTCLQGSYPPGSNPACASTLQTLLPEFLRERSAYYQNSFFQNIASHPSYRIPVFNAATFTDPLFPASENRTMLNRLRSVVPNYPIRVFHGDYQHFTQNKATEWADICQSGTGPRHPCAGPADYPNGNYNSLSPNLVRKGVTTRLNRFIDHYAKPPGNPNQPTPPFNVTAELQICPQNAGSRPAGEPGPTFTAPTFEQLAPHTLDLSLAGTQVTTSEVEPNPHAANSDPIANFAGTGGKCPVETQPAGSGVAVYTSAPIATGATMIGATEVTANFSASPGASAVELNARLYDVFPDGTAVLVDRGPRRVTDAEAQSGSVTFELHGNGWRFEQGHRIRIELAQDDDPFLKASSVPSSLTLTGVDLAIPIR